MESIASHLFAFILLGLDYDSFDIQDNCSFEWHFTIISPYTTLAC